MRPAATLALESGHARALAEAAARLEHARAQAPAEVVHRSARRLSPGRGSVGVALCVAAAVTLLLWVARPLVMEAWQSLVLWWSGALGIPLAIVDDGMVRRWTYVADARALLPGQVTGVLTATGVIAAFAATWWTSDRFVPLKFLVRTLCVVQASALVFFMTVPSLFPYTVGSHLTAMLESGYGLMLVLPLLLALGYGLLDLPLLRKLADPLLVVAYFMLALPHKAVLHMLVLQHFSVLFMPLLYLCFGLVFDIMLFVALYSWLASRAPRLAVG